MNISAVKPPRRIVILPQSERTCATKDRIRDKNANRSEATRRPAFGAVTAAATENHLKEK
jgi:hypothetical protein